MTATPPAEPGAARGEGARDADDNSALRYAVGGKRNAVAWWLHDCFIHPLTGTMGLTGRLMGSLRLLTLAHHIHNVSAPSDDVLADYAEAAYRATCNETRGNPMGSMTPDEQEHARARYRDITGEESFVPGEQAFEALQRMGKHPWTGQDRGVPPPTDKEFEEGRGKKPSTTWVSPLVELSDALDWLRKENVISQHAIAQLAKDPELLERWFRWKEERGSKP